MVFQLSVKFVCKIQELVCGCWDKPDLNFLKQDPFPTGASSVPWKQGTPNPANFGIIIRLTRRRRVKIEGLVSNTDGKRCSL